MVHAAGGAGASHRRAHARHRADDGRRRHDHPAGHARLHRAAKILHQWDYGCGVEGIEEGQAIL